MEVFVMDRAEWLKKVRIQAESLYDHGAPAYWVIWGISIDSTHQHFIDEFLSRLESNSMILDAACGAGRFDGILLEAGHRVLGIDQSGGVLARAREHFPEMSYPNLGYEKIGLQEMEFTEEFDGIICMDAMEHICPEDWPVILENFQKALKPGGILYITVDEQKLNEDTKAYERAKTMGLPVVFGEIVDELDDTYAEAMARDPLDLNSMPFDRLDHTVYHFHPSREQVGTWFNQAGLTLGKEEPCDGYVHVLVRKKKQ
jgi:2-polyprenyl-3-methyl-5-hydroxy-6-metoxy-1,4-benzoquinol methylase